MSSPTELQSHPFVEVLSKNSRYGSSFEVVKKVKAGLSLE